MTSMKQISNNAFPYPMPMTVVSAEVEGRVNHLAIAWITRANLNPPMLAMSLYRGHFTNSGIRAHRELGVSIPSIEQAKAVDYAGLGSGASTDKSRLFELFYGSLAHAPMIAGFPLTMACRVVQIVDLPSHDLIVAEIVEAYAEEACLTNGTPDVAKMHPYTLSMPDNRYFAVGECVGKAWSIGRG